MKSRLHLVFICLHILIDVCHAQSYDDWSWVEKFAAIGDSFTAGIGAGSIWSTSDDSIACSRYDSSYPAVMNRVIGGLKSFYYPACSGATSDKILDQIESLPSDLDLVVMTAGGNDLCLVSAHIHPARICFKRLCRRLGADKEQVKHHLSMHSKRDGLGGQLPGGTQQRGLRGQECPCRQHPNAAAGSRRKDEKGPNRRSCRILPLLQSIQRRMPE